MRILVTGGNGFLGRTLVYKLTDRLKDGDILVWTARNFSYTYENNPISEHGFKNDVAYAFGCECQLDSKNWVQRLLSSFKPDVIYHIAGCATVSSPAEKIWRSNVDTTFNLLEYLPKSDRKVRFILASSINARNSNTVYAASKIAAESLVEAYTQSGKVNGTSVRLCALAGAFNTHGAVKAVVDKFMREEKVQLLTDSFKPYSYVNEVAERIIEVTNNMGEVDYYRFPHVSICPSRSISISYIANLAKELIGTNKPFSFTKESWVGDEAYVNPPYETFSAQFFKPLMRSEQAVEMAIKDILKLEYGVVNE